MISLLVNTLKQNQIDTLYKPLSHFSLGISSKSCIGNYLSLTIKMFIRSPRLRQQMLSYLLITIAYYYLISKQEINFSQMGLLYTSIIFILFPLIFNQFLFSAEAAFFDHMMITPNFRTILLARYILYLVFSVISFVILLFLFPFSWELIAILLYCAGCITLLSFSSILFISKKIDLFGSQYKMMTQTSSAQSFTVLLVYALLISLVILISFVFSPQIAVWFMFITGVVSILFSNAWLKYLYRCFYPNKYEKMEIFRIQ
ncbi:hypothetical protein AGMMS4957_11020 [Bacteroidia bacterium]|nr:hypothetical protein AGMMS4957_11020 [Bacteroidia bacterium]